MKNGFLVFMILTLVAIRSGAQEVCDNGIDDDGNGLIDLLDPSCACYGIGIDSLTSLIPNPSFEDTLCCPTNLSQLNCASGWIQASYATTDYFNTCGLASGYQAPSLPLPGGGSGYIGFVNNFTFGTSHWKEYAGACINSPILAGQEYLMNFYLSRSRGSDTLVVGIFGTPNCTDLPWDSHNCPIGEGAWLLLGQDTVILRIDSVTFTPIWEEVNIRFYAPIDIYAVAIGPSCDIPLQSDNKYYADELTLVAISEFDSATIIESGKWCTNDLQLEAGFNIPGGQWQWYKSGVALIGETSFTLNPMVYGINEVYTAVYSLNGDCVSVDYMIDTTDPANRPRTLEILNQDTTVCEGTVLEIRAVGTRGYHYQWSPTTGINDPSSLTPEIAVFQDTSVLYTLTESYPGCPDTSAQLHVQMEYYPTVELGEDTLVCQGERVPLSGLIQPYRPDYEYVWLPDEGFPLSNSLNNYFIADSSVMYRLNVYTPAGCLGSDSLTIEVRPGGFARVSADTGFCPPSEIPLQAWGGIVFRWEPGSSLNRSDIANPVASPLTPTEYTVYVTDDLGCIDTESVFVDVYPLAVLNMPDTIRIYPGDQYHLEPGTNCHYFDWFPTSGINSIKTGDPVFAPTVRTRYFVTARTEHGCVITDSIDILVEETVLDMPNAFVPGNGLIPKFRPARRGIAKLLEFSVYNRWGNRVFHTTDIDVGWDGTYQGVPQPLGVYVYHIEAITDSGERFLKNGNVTLLR